MPMLLYTRPDKTEIMLLAEPPQDRAVMEADSHITDDQVIPVVQAEAPVSWHQAFHTLPWFAAFQPRVKPSLQW